MRVCILGNSLSSLTLAKALVNENIYVDVYSQFKDPKHNKSRTIGISRSNIDFFNHNIIDIRKLLWKLNKIEIYTDNLKNEKLLNFENGNNQLFSIFKNYDLYKVLNKDLKKSKLFKKKIKFKFATFANNYDLIINCDYNHSITKKFFSKKIEKSYNSLAYTTIIQHKKISNNTAIQIFTKKGPIAFLPISDKKTSIVYSLHNNNSKNKFDLRSLIEKYNPKYSIQKIEKIENISLKSLNLRSYYHNNIIAFGDLLHRLHPLAGQGFNMTMRDLRELMNIIKNKKDLGLPLDISVGIEFEKNTKHKNLLFSNGIDLVHEFFNLERKTNNKILSKTIQYFGKNPSLNRIFTKFADNGIMI